MVRTRLDYKDGKAKGASDPPGMTGPGGRMIEGPGEMHKAGAFNFCS